MIHSLILRIATPNIIAIQVLVSVFLVTKGHNEPGGGFSGGLVAASAGCLYALAFGVEALKSKLRIPLSALLSIGFLVILLSGAAGPFFYNTPLFSALWITSFNIPILGKFSLGTPFLFEIGIYIVVFVLGVTAITEYLEWLQNSDPPQRGSNAK